MNRDVLIRTTIDGLVHHLSDPRHGGDHLYHLVARQIGYRVLNDFERGSRDPNRQAWLHQVLSGEVRRDPAFADSLDQAVHNHAVHNSGIQGHGNAQGHGNTVTHNSGAQSGNVVHGDMRVTSRSRKTQIGNVRIGTGGIVMGVVAVALLGGGTAAVVSMTGKTVALDQAVGRWELQGGSPVSGIRTDAMVLTVNPDGSFTFTFGMSVSGPGPGAVRVDCAGAVQPDGDHFTLRATRGQCGTFQAKPAGGGSTLDVFLADGSANGSVPLTKVR